MYLRVNKVLKFKQRTKFGTTSYFYLILTISTLFLSIQLFQSDDLAILGLLCLFFVLLFVSLILNIQGVDIDLNKKIVIIYKKVLWFRIDKRINLTEFNNICISKDKLVVSTSEYSEYESDIYYYYFLSLTGNINKAIILAESQDYSKIAHTAQKLSIDLKMKIIDKLYNRTKKR